MITAVAMVTSPTVTTKNALVRMITTTKCEAGSLSVVTSLWFVLGGVDCGSSLEVGGSRVEGEGVLVGSTVGGSEEVV